MPERVFNMDDQLEFARLSGDFNELHIDEVAARRTLFGAPVVHGINALLWALDSSLPGNNSERRIATLKALFTHQIKVGDEVRFETVKSEADRIKVRIYNGSIVAMTITVTFNDAPAQDSALWQNRSPERISAIEHDDQSIAKAQGELFLELDQELLISLYPNLAANINPVELAIILGSTRIVGMHCPGKHSLYSELQLKYSDTVDTEKLSYEVESFDDRFGLIDMQLHAPGMTGVIRAFKRPAPQQQATFEELSKLITAGEFENQRALIVGGSRGLGEVAAKLLAAGGADVRITYHQGETEAAALVEEITSAGGKASHMKVNVLEPEASEDDWQATHLYYFATPFITPGTPGDFSLKLFSKFCDYYVFGLMNVMQNLQSDPFHQIFLPSSVYVEDPPDNLQEYAAAKSVAEQYGEFANSTGIIVYSPRLPRMATDQTANVAAMQSDEPAPVMLEELRTFSAKY